MGRPITTGRPTPATIMIVKIAFLALGLLCAALQWQSLRSFLSYQDYHLLADEAARGRQEANDVLRMAALLKQPPGGANDARALRTNAILHMYHADLNAISEGLAPLQLSERPETISARRAAYQHLQIAAANAPLDGDLWLRLAVTARSLGYPEQKIDTYVKRSKETAPHEGWILRRRDSFLP